MLPFLVEHLLLISAHVGHLDTIRPDSEPFPCKLEAMALFIRAHLATGPRSERGTRKINWQTFFSGKKTSPLFVYTLVMVHCHPPPECKYPSEMIQYSHVSWWECGSSKGLLLCMLSIIYLFVVFYVD